MLPLIDETIGKSGQLRHFPGKYSVKSEAVPDVPGEMVVPEKIPGRGGDQRWAVPLRNTDNEDISRMVNTNKLSEEP